LEVNRYWKINFDFSIGGGGKGNENPLCFWRRKSTAN